MDMEFDCKVYVVDALMGSGKSQAIINYINSASDDEKFLVITPYLSEIERYKKFCASKNFKAPSYIHGTTKLEDIKKLINAGDNIVSTHALFSDFDNETIDLCRAANYTLIMDEVAEVISEHPLTSYDLDILVQGYADLDPETGRLTWRKDKSDYKGYFHDEKRICEMGGLVRFKDGTSFKLMPVQVFNGFRKIYILTYLFELQMQKYYYDLYGLKYTYLSVEGDSLDTYHLVPKNEGLSYIKYDYSKLIHIVDSEKLNRIGDREHDLSKTWYKRNSGNASMKILQNNIQNFFRHIRNDKADDNLWTTFKESESQLRGKGYSKGFLALNSRATNEFRDRTSIAYPVNRFVNPFIKGFFQEYGIEIDEDGFALSEMLQFLWRSAIRDGKEIWVYIPSVRMRRLLQQWIADNPLIYKEETHSEISESETEL